LAIKETKERNAYLELEANIELNNLKNEKKKKEQCCFKKRLVDGFVIGATRSYFSRKTPKELSKNKKDKVDSILITDLVNKDEILFILQIMAYADSLGKAGRDLEKIETAHEVIFDLSKCVQIGEEYFKAGWDTPNANNFSKIVIADHPDSKLVGEIDFTDIQNLDKD